MLGRLSALIVFASVAGSVPAWMSDEDIRGAFAGHTVDGVYTTGLTFSESYSSNGRLDYREGPHDAGRRMSGDWSIVDGAFCTFYDTTAQGGCFRVRQLGRNCYAFYYLAATKAEITDVAEPKEFTARGWRRNEPSDCVGVPAV